MHGNSDEPFAQIVGTCATHVGSRGTQIGPFDAGTAVSICRPLPAMCSRTQDLRKARGVSDWMLRCPHPFIGMRDSRFHGNGMSSIAGAPSHP